MTARRIRLTDITNGDYHSKEGFEPNYILTPRGMRVSRLGLVATVVDTFTNDEETYGAITLDDGTDTLRTKFFQELDDMDGIEVGDIVEVIGKVREYDGETYIQPELLKQRDIQHELLFTLEVEHLRQRWQQAVEKAQQMQDQDRAQDDIIQELKGLGLTQDDAESVLEYLSVEEQFDTASDVEAETGSPTEPAPDEGQAGGAPVTEEDQEDEDDNAQRLVLGAIEQLDDGDGADYSAIIENTDLPEERIEDVINTLLSDGTCYEPKPGRIKKL